MERLVLCCRGCRSRGPKKWLASGVQLHSPRRNHDTSALYIPDPSLPTPEVGYYYVDALSIQLLCVNVYDSPFLLLVDKLLQ